MSMDGDYFTSSSNSSITTSPLIRGNFESSTEAEYQAAYRVSHRSPASHVIEDNEIPLPLAKQTVPQVNEYPVHKIVGGRIQGGKLYYRVHWEGYPKEERTWEPLKNLQNALHAVQAFERAACKKRSLERRLKSRNVCPQLKKRQLRRSSHIKI